MFKVNTMFGAHDVTISKETYKSNGNLAIQMYEEEDGGPFPFATLTVNLDKKLPEDVAFVDTNNCPWAEEFIEENGLGHPTGRMGQSGRCFYPQYRFDLSKIA